MINKEESFEKVLSDWQKEILKRKGDRILISFIDKQIKEQGK